jgi:hypothetical protein
MFYMSGNQASLALNPTENRLESEKAFTIFYSHGYLTKL